MDVQRSKRLAPVGLWTAAQALALGEREEAGLRLSPFSPLQRFSLCTADWKR